MNVQTVEFDKDKAAELCRLYKEHRNAQTKVDWQIEQVYRQIARGKKVIQAIASITRAGMNAKGQPVLAICRADAKLCLAHTNRDVVAFVDEDKWGYSKGIEVRLPGMTYMTPNCRARLPLIPVHLRPKAALSNYHILWEADWEDVPRDPMLLRRMGGDLWLVLAAWDLTEIERAVLGGSPTQ